MSNVLRICAIFVLLCVYDKQSSAFEFEDDTNTWYLYFWNGNNGTFSCQPPFSRDRLQLWVNNSIEIRLGDRVSYDPGVGFRMKNITHADVGIYKCTVKIGRLIRTLKTFNLQVLERSTGTHIKVADYKFHHLSEGEDFHLNCTTQVTRTRLVAIDWIIPRKNQNRITFKKYFAGKRPEYIKTAELILKNVSLADAGEYTCRLARLTSDNAEDRTTVLTVHKSVELPEANVITALMYVRDGSNASFPCPTTSAEQRARLYIDGDYEIAMDSRVSYNPTWGFKMGNFTIKDTGIYKCTIEENNLIHLIKKFDVEVLRSPRALWQPEIDESKLRHIVEGQQVQVNCTAEFIRDEQYYIFWILPRADDYRMFVEQGSMNKSNRTIAFAELTIQNVSVRDAGVYRCRSGTLRAPGQSSEMKTVLTVLHKPSR